MDLVVFKKNAMKNTRRIGKLLDSETFVEGNEEHNKTETSGEPSSCPGAEDLTLELQPLPSGAPC